MWPFSEMSLATVSLGSTVANRTLLASLVGGVLSTFVIVQTTDVKEAYWEKDRRESAEHVAALGVQGDQLRKDTADANARAANAELKLAEFRRARSIGPDKSAKIVAAIRPFAGTNFDIGHAPIAREQWDFLWQLEPVFPKAGWVFKEWMGHGFSKLNWTMTPHYYGEANVLNVSIQVDAQSRDRLLPAAEALVKVLNEIGITAAIETTGSGSGNVDAVHILVGEKR